MERITLPRLYSTVAGTLLASLGLAGFLVSSEFRNPELTSDLLGIYPVNGWVSSLHLVAGLIGLALAGRLPRLFALLAGVGFTALGLSGVLAPNGELLFGCLPAPRTVNLIYLGIGLLGLLAVVASRWDRIGATFAGWIEKVGRRRERMVRRRREKRLRKRRRAARATSSGGRAGGTRPGSGRR